MSDLRRRLRKLERSLTDTSGFVPHTPPWMNYWMHQLEKTLAGADHDPKEAFRSKSYAPGCKPSRVLNSADED